MTATKMTRRRLSLVDDREILRAQEERHMPDLASYDVIVLSTSGGKDSIASAHYVDWLCRSRGLQDRIVQVHAELGEVEWEGTRGLVGVQAKHFGHRLEYVSRIGRVSKGASRGLVPLYERGERYGDLLEQVRRRWEQLRAKGAYVLERVDAGASDDDIVADAERDGFKLGARYVASVRETRHPGVPWPDAQNRWCTADFKRGPIERLFTQLAKDWRERTGITDRPCRILDCWGLRAEESPGRAKRERFAKRKRSTTQHVDTWLPIKWWTEEQVWECIRTHALPYHRAYDLGMPRLSCRFCVLANREALMVAAEHNPRLLDRYVALEEETGTTFQAGLSLAEVRDAVARGERVTKVESWVA